MSDAGPANAQWNPRELALYFALAFGFSTAIWFPVLAGWHVSHLFLQAGTFGPTIAAFATHRIVAGNWRAVRLWTGPRGFLLGTASGGATVLISAFAAAALMTRSGFERWQWPALLQIFTLFGPNLLGGPVGEEPGWRGYALPRLQRRLPPAAAAAILGLIWASWHIPLMLAHIYNVTWWQFFAVTTAASVFLSFGFNRSRGSTLCAVVVHGLYNVATGIILNDFIGKAALRSNPVQHNIFWMTYSGVAGLLCVVTKGRLR